MSPGSDQCEIGSTQTHRINLSFISTTFNYLLVAVLKIMLRNLDYLFCWIQRVSFSKIDNSSCTREVNSTYKPSCNLLLGERSTDEARGLLEGRGGG